MRRSIFAVAICASTLVLVAGRCSGDDEEASAPAATESEAPVPAEANSVTSDAAAVIEGDGEGAGAPAGDATVTEPEAPEVKEPDDMFKDPLSAPDDAAGAADDTGELPPTDETPIPRIWKFDPVKFVLVYETFGMLSCRSVA